MSFSNADTGSKPADPYKAENLDQTSIKEKIEDLVDFISSCKFGYDDNSRWLNGSFGVQMYGFGWQGIFLSFNDFVLLMNSRRMTALT